MGWTSRKRNAKQSPSSTTMDDELDSNNDSSLSLSNNHNSSIATPQWQDPDLAPLEPIVLQGYLGSTRSRLLQDPATTASSMAGSRSVSVNPDSIESGDTETSATHTAATQSHSASSSLTSSPDICVGGQVCENIRGLLPTRLELKSTWKLVYSMEQDGTSLHTLYRKMAAQVSSNSAAASRPGFVLAVKDDHGNLFGAYVNEPIMPHDNRRYAGNGDCFLWKTTHLAKTKHHGSSTSHCHSPSPDSSPDDHRFEAFPYTGLNDFVMYCTRQFLSLGGGDGHYGLWLDDSLATGVSSRCLTFGNSPLSDRQKFHIHALEVWCIG